MSFPGYVSPTQLRWRGARSWGELRTKWKAGRISGLRVRWCKPDAFLRRAPADKLRTHAPAAAVSAAGQLEELTVWREARLLEVGRRSAAVDLEGGSRMTLTSLDGFEILVETEG